MHYGLVVTNFRKCFFDAKNRTFRPIFRRVQSYLNFCQLQFILHSHKTQLCTNLKFPVSGEFGESMGSISRKCFACQYDINLVLAKDSCVLSRFECVRKRQNTDDITFKRRSLQSIIIKNDEMGPFLGSSTTAMFCII